MKSTSSLVTVLEIVQVWYLMSCDSKIQKCTLTHDTHYQITDLVNHGMVKNTKTWISWEWSITFLQNRKNLNLCIRWNILRSYCFVANVTSKLTSVRELWMFNIWIIKQSGQILFVPAMYTFTKFSFIVKVWHNHWYYVKSKKVTFSDHSFNSTFFNDWKLHETIHLQYNTLAERFWGFCPCFGSYICIHTQGLI